MIPYALPATSPIPAPGALHDFLVGNRRPGAAIVGAAKGPSEISCRVPVRWTVICDETIGVKGSVTLICMPVSFQLERQVNPCVLALAPMLAIAASSHVCQRRLNVFRDVDAHLAQEVNFQLVLGAE